MAQSLFIGSLAYATTDQELQELFEKIGPVESAKVIRDHESNRSKGFGFVEYKDDADNQKAIDAYNGKDVDGRTISVALAKPKTAKPSFGRRAPSVGNNMHKRSW